jgi:hypothetical protein
MIIREGPKTLSVQWDGDVSNMQQFWLIWRTDINP